MARHLDLATLRSFVAVAETGGVTRAAHRLHLTQSGVSMQLKRLEEALGVQLHTREGRGVVLTKQGEELLGHARRLLAMNDEIWRRLTKTAFEGELTLGMPIDIGYPIAPMVLKRFDQDHPNVRVSMITRQSRELLQLHAAGDLDVILTTEFDQAPGAETVARGPLVWVGAEGGTAWRRRPIPLAYSNHCIFRKVAFETLDAAGLVWDWRIETDCSASETASISADLAICTLMRGTVPAGLVEIEHGGALPLLPSTCVNLYVGEGPNAEMAAELGAYVRAAVAEVTPSAALDSAA